LNGQKRLFLRSALSTEGKENVYRKRVGLMGLATFKGGIHPYEGKELSENKPVQVLTSKGEMVFPMAQHIGAPAKPLVAKGDRVLVGQKIGEAGGFISANVICSVSGTVKAVEPRLMVNGTMVTSVIVENDGMDEKIEHFGEDRDYTKLSKDEIRNIVKEAGIVGLGGAGFPTNVKLSPKDDSKIDYILVNGAECEPYLTSDYRMMLEEPERIVGGLKVILSLFDNAKGVIGIENNKPEGIKKLQELVKDEPRIEVCPLLTKYPQGGERSLIYAITGRKVNSSMLPADAGCIVDNIDTVIAIYNAVCKQTPLIRKIITVTGDAIVNPQNFSVRLGTNYQELLEAAGGFKADPEKVISGGPMMGMSLFSLDLPVTKTSSALTCFSKDMVAAQEPTPCIRCGRCVSACPSHIVPPIMMQAALRGDCDAFEKVNGMECMECGSCTYVCPAKRPLTQAFKDMRKQVAANRRKKA
jgi:electron transport complex protein RnfC